MPGKAWVVTFAGIAINLCFGILYAWSVWGASLIVPKNLGFNYGLVFPGWGPGFFTARPGGTIRDMTGILSWAFYLCGLVLIVAEILARITKRPCAMSEAVPASARQSLLGFEKFSVGCASLSPPCIF